MANRHVFWALGASKMYFGRAPRSQKLPLPKNPSPLSAFGLEFRPFGSQKYPLDKFLAMPMGSVSNQIGAKVPLQRKA